MKNKFFILLALSCFTLQVFSQDTLHKKQWKDNPKNIIKLSPTSFVASTFLLGFERAVGKYTSLQFCAGATAYQRNANSPDEKSILGGSAELQFRIYLLPRIKNLKGLYAAPYYKYQNVTIKNEYNNYSYPNGSYTPIYTTVKQNYNVVTNSGGFILGYQFIFWHVLALDLYGGGGLQVSDTNRGSNSNIDDGIPYTFFPIRTGITPKVGFKIGVAF